MTRNARPLALAALLALFVASPALLLRAEDAKVSGDLKKVQGAWTFTGEQGEENQLTFEGAELKATVGGQMYVSKVSFDSKAEPLPAVDFKITIGPEDQAGLTVLGIYKLEGEKLTLCVAIPGQSERPKEYKRIDNETILMELKRAGN